MKVRRSILRMSLLLCLAAAPACGGIAMKKFPTDADQRPYAQQEYPVGAIRLYEKTLETVTLMRRWRIDLMEPSTLEVTAINRDGDRLRIAVSANGKDAGRLEVVSEATERMIDFGADHANLREFLKALEDRIETP